MAKAKTKASAKPKTDAPEPGVNIIVPPVKEDAPKVGAATDDMRVAPHEGIVARGRTVQDERGNHQPGQKVTGTKAAIERLRRLGFLVDPNRILMPLGNGPTYFQQDTATARGAPEKAA